MKVYLSQPLQQLGCIDDTEGAATGYKYIGSRLAQKKSYSSQGLINTYTASYDNLGRITSADSGSSIAQFEYGYYPNTNNIKWQRYDHRTNDPCVVFSYDNIDRLTGVVYNMDSTDESFTIDKLGNRSSVNPRSGSNISYTVNNLTNRYTYIGLNSLSYDNAGNLTTDKDGYGYEYDYENRIVKITKSGQTKAEIDYDALGRRIQVVAGGTTRRFYYDNDWRVLMEYDNNNAVKKAYAWGNYIDEALFSYDYAAQTPQYYFYALDHLYSPVALVDDNGSVVERYEYDAYGSCNVLEPNFADDADGLSDYGNSIAFNGKRRDLFDSGNLSLMHWLKRDYSAYMGRWYQEDPLGVVPNESGNINQFKPNRQYSDSANLYEFVCDNPVSGNDMWGLDSGDVFEYKNDTHGFAIPYSGHAGILIGDEDVDFGPDIMGNGFPLYTLGECPWTSGGPGREADKTKVGYTKKRLHKNITGSMEVAGKRKCCKCATWGEIKQCIRKRCQNWNGATYSFGFNDCGSFVVDVKVECCLRRMPVPPTYRTSVLAGM